MKGFSGITKRIMQSVRKAVGKKQAPSSADGAVVPGMRKDNMAGMAIEAKKGGMIKKSKSSDKMGRAISRKTADAKGRALKKGK